MSLPMIRPTTGMLLGAGGAALVVGILYTWEKVLTQKWVNACQEVYGPLGRTEQRTIRLIVQSFDYFGDGDPRKLAYILATVDAECSFISKKEHPTSYNVRQEYWQTNYMGRGLIQVTKKSNYQKISDLLGVDFVTYPEKALELPYAVRILVQGMMIGLFSRRKLGDYINNQQTDFYRARQVVNGLDKAAIIAGNAAEILAYYQS